MQKAPQFTRFSPNILTQLMADMNFCKTCIDWPLYLTLTLTHVIDNSHYFICPSWDISGAVIAVEVVASFHRAEGVDSIENPDPIAVTVGNQWTARIPAAGLQDDNSIDFFHFWRYLGVTFGHFFELVIKEYTSNKFKTAINLVFMETFHNLQMAWQILTIGIQEFY